MKRKDYQRPTMEVVLLRQTGMLMESGTEVERSNYGAANKNVSESEKDATSGVWKWY